MPAAVRTANISLALKTVATRQSAGRGRGWERARTDRPNREAHVNANPFPATWRMRLQGRVQAVRSKVTCAAKPT